MHRAIESTLNSDQLADDPIDRVSSSLRVRRLRLLTCWGLPTESSTNAEYEREQRKDDAESG